MTSSWPFRRPIVLFDEANSPACDGGIQVSHILAQLADLPRRQCSDASPSAALADVLPVSARSMQIIEPARGVAHDNLIASVANKNGDGGEACHAIRRLEK